MSTNLLARMAALKAESNTSVRSKEVQATPLWVYLYIYERSKRECYMDYMAGAKALLSYLAPLELPTDKFPAIDDTHCPVPSLLRGYESSALASVLIGYVSCTQLPELRRMERAIMLSMYKEVLPLLY